MKLSILSDLHLEFSLFDLPLDHESDVIINAGDLHPDPDFREFWLEKRNMLFVPGNHDYYKGTWPSKTDGTFFVEIDGVTIAGATLWSDLSNPLDWINFKSGLADYRLIKDITQESYMEVHNFHKQFLFDSKADIIVTHHAPSYMSVHPRFKTSAFNACFATELSNEIRAMGEEAPKLWIHGHMHDSCDYFIPGTNTRVICHPRGYRNEVNFANYKPLKLEI